MIVASESLPHPPFLRPFSTALGRKLDMFPHIGIRDRLPVDLDRLFEIAQAQLGFEQLL